MPLQELRGVWITSTASSVLDSKSHISEAISFLADQGFNTVFPVVWNNGYTLFQSRVMQTHFGSKFSIKPIYEHRDPLSELIDAACQANLKVIPWFEYGFASSYQANGGHILEKKPEWKAINNAGKLLNKNGFYWMNTLDLEVQQWMLDLVLEVAKNYDITGVQGDDRLPALPVEGGYDLSTKKLYRQQFDCDPPLDFKQSNWISWRADQITKFLSQLYKSIKNINPNLIVSIAPSPHPFALKEYLQDTPTWVEQGLVDMIHPQLYRRNFSQYKSLFDTAITKTFQPKDLTKIFPGVLIKIGDYLISDTDLTAIIHHHRSHGIQGEVFFFYEGLRAQKDRLAKILYADLYRQKAATFF